MNRTKVARAPRGDRGAAAVEFALVLPLLIAMILGMIDFGRAYNQQITLTQLAREGARLIAKYSTRELEAICRFLEGSRVLQRKHAQRIRSMADAGARRRKERP